jgi:hypothetical protein
VLKLTQALVWAVERGLEMVLLAWLMVELLGPTNTPGVEGKIANVVLGIAYVAYAFVVSGYLVTTAWFAIVRMRAKPLLHCAVIGILFTAHMLFFTASWGIPQKWTIAFWGVVISLLASFAGSMLFHVVARRIPGQYKPGISPTPGSPA